MKKKFYILIFMFIFFASCNVYAYDYQKGESVILKDGSRWNVVNVSGDNLTLINENGLSKVGDNDYNFIYNDKTHLQDNYLKCGAGDQSIDNTKEVWVPFNFDVNSALTNNYLNNHLKNDLRYVDSNKINNVNVRLLSPDDLVNGFNCDYSQNRYNDYTTTNDITCNESLPDWLTKKYCDKDNDKVSESQNFWTNIERENGGGWNQHWAFREYDMNGNQVNNFTVVANDWTNALRPVIDIDKAFVAPIIEFVGYEDVYRDLVLLDKQVKEFDDVVKNEDVQYDVFNSFDGTNSYYQPTKEGYEFAGWYLDSEFNEKVTSQTEFEGKVKLYAKFNKIQNNDSVNESDNNKTTNETNNNIKNKENKVENPKTFDNIKAVSIILLLAISSIIELLILKRKLN